MTYMCFSRRQVSSRPSYAENKGLRAFLCINELATSRAASNHVYPPAGQNCAFRAINLPLSGASDNELGLQIVQESPAEFRRLPKPVAMALKQVLFPCTCRGMH